MRINNINPYVAINTAKLYKWYDRNLRYNPQAQNKLIESDLINWNRYELTLHGVNWLTSSFVMYSPDDETAIKIYNQQFNLSGEYTITKGLNKQTIKTTYKGD